MDVAIRTEGLTKRYGDVTGIVGVDLEVPAGSIFGFLGPNGAGKTTTLRLLLDLIRPTDGRAEVLGTDTREGGVELRRRLGYLDGDLSLHDRISAGEHLRWLGRLRGGVAPASIERLADRLGLDLGRRIHELSKGNRQKVGLVQAFMHEPELLVLDEPTGGLDPLVQQTFEEMVRDVAAEGRTVFLSSHVLSEVEDVCDHVAIVRAGQLVATADVHTLRRQARREVVIRFEEAAPLAELGALEGVSELSSRDSSVAFRFAGSPDLLLGLLARHRVADLTIAPTDLESVFLGYYQEAPADADR